MVRKIKRMGGTPMYNCPYADGMKCNQKKIMCERGVMDMHCLMTVLRQLNKNIEANHHYIRRDGMEMVLDFLQRKNMLRGCDHLSINDILDMYEEDCK